MAKIDCSELSKGIYQLAQYHATDPSVKTLDDVINKMRERLPELDRKRVADSIVEATTGKAAVLTEAQKTLNAIKQEAKKDKSLRDAVENLEQVIAGKKKPDPKKKRAEPKPPPEAIKKLQDERDRLQKRIDAAEEPDGLQKLAREYAKRFVEYGIRDREALLNAVHNELTRSFPNVSRRVVMDAISGYGNYSELSTEETEVVLRDLKGQMQQLAKLEDMASGKAPKKTGQERRAPSDIERELIAQVNEAKKAGGYDITDPAKQLKSALDSIKTRLRNQIKDLEKQISSGEQIVKERRAAPTDAEADALRSRRDALKKQYDAIFKRGLSDEQRIAAAKRATQKSINEYTRRLQEKDFSKRQHRETPVTPELAALRAQRDALKKQYDAENPNPPNIARMREKLAELNDHLAKGTLPKVTPRSKPEEGSQEALLSEAISGVRKALRNSEPALRKKYEDQIAEMQRRLEENKFVAPVSRKTVPATKELEKLEYERDRLRRRIRTKIRDLKPRSLSQKLADPFNAARAVMTSFDFSGVLRQGGFIAFGHPVRAAKAMVPMLRAFASKQNAHAIEQELLNRPNAPLYARAGLYLSTEDNAFSQKEEAYMTSWLDRVKDHIKWDPVNASADAYVTFLNVLRADSFDVMVETLGKNREVTEEESRAIANYVNVATGRGSLGNFEQAGIALNTIFFAPRYVASRFQIILGQPFHGGSWSTRGMIAQEYARYAIGVGLVYGLASMLLNNDDDETTGVSGDGRSSDFMKVRLGNTRLDFLSGFGQVAVLIARIGEGKRTNEFGEVTVLRGEGKSFGAGVFEEIAKFGRYKLSPHMGFALNIADGENAIGQPTTVGNELVNMVVPLSFRDILNAMEDQGVPKGTAVSLLALLGAGLNVYEERE